MQIVLLLLLISQNFNVVQLNNREKRFVNIIKRDVHSSSLQNLNRYTKTYETGENIIFDSPNFTWIDSLLSTTSPNRSKPSIREHTTWLMRHISFDQYREIARYHSIKNRFILHSHENDSYTIHPNTGQLTLINTNNTNLLYTEISIHAESGISKGDDILHDIYRFIRLSTTSINCTTNVSINIDESIEIECTIEYEFFQYDDLKNYQPTINFTFYLKENNSLYTPIDQMYLHEIKDIQIDGNRTLNWKRLISYRMKSINKGENSREYICMITPDTLEKKDLLEENNRICRTRIIVRNNQSSTVIFSRIDQLDLIDIFIIILIVVSILLFLISIVLCLAARQYHKKHIVQIKPENKPSPLSLNTNQISSNNNKIQSAIPLNSSQNFSSETFSSHHKPGCPKYHPSSASNLLSSDLFTHTTIDNIKKIILPDIPETTDLFNDQTYIHFYLPSKEEIFQ